MCDGFGMIIIKTLEGFFCEPDEDGNCSHSEILSRLGWEDNENQFLRNFVRVQCPDWTIELFEFDEEDTLPGWAEENRDQIINLVNNTLRKVCPVWGEYEKNWNILSYEYSKIITPVKNKYQIAYQNALKQYYHNHTITKTEYNDICKLAENEYDIIHDLAKDKYKKAFNSAKKQMLEEMSNIKGYVF